MPKLGQAHAKKVGASDLPNPEGGFSLLPDGLYLFRLEAVDVIPPKNPGDKNSYAQWQCSYVAIEDITEGGSGNQHKGAKVMDWLSLSPLDYPVALMAEFFSAFGKTPADDTDDFMGDECVLEVGHSVRQYGKRKGQTGNDVLRRLPANFGMEEEEPASGAAAPAAAPAADDELGEEPF